MLARKPPVTLNNIIKKFQEMSFTEGKKMLDTFEKYNKTKIIKDKQLEKDVEFLKMYYESNKFYYS